jgi:hypothetical protein
VDTFVGDDMLIDVSGTVLAFLFEELVLVVSVWSFLPDMWSGSIWLL